MPETSAMCRLAAYLGPEVTLQQFLLDPPHSLYVQSWAPKELRYAKLNADGFGFAWYGPDDLPHCYVNAMPIWSDVNLTGLATSMGSDLWVASVRSATSGYATGVANTQPFADGELVFTHNGYIGEFARSMRTRLLDHLDTDVAGEIRGNTDSEHLFALLRHLLLDEDRSIETALAEAFALIERWSSRQESLLNLILSDGERLYAARHAIEHDCPSLYYSTDDEAFPDGAQLVSSEPLTEGGFWQPVPEHHLLVLDAEAPPELIAL
jgi:glutamine amidotransferase